MKPALPTKTPSPGSLPRLVRPSHRWVFEKPRCPYCAGKLTVAATAWTERDDKTWEASELQVDCETEPDIKSPEWRSWIDQHTDMPYEHWLPVEQRILRFINARYRWDLDRPNKAIS